MRQRPNNNRRKTKFRKKKRFYENKETRLLKNSHEYGIYP